MEIKDAKIVESIGSEVIRKYIEEIKPADMVIRDVFKSGAHYGFAKGYRKGRVDISVERNVVIPFLSFTLGAFVTYVMWVFL